MLSQDWSLEVARRGFGARIGNGALSAGGPGVDLVLLFPVSDARRHFGAANDFSAYASLSDSEKIC